MEVMGRNEWDQHEEEDEVEEVMSLQGRRRSNINTHRAEEASEDVQKLLNDHHIHLAPEDGEEEESVEEKNDAELNYGFPGMQLASAKLSVKNGNQELDSVVKTNGKQKLDNTVQTNGDQESDVTGKNNGDLELDDTIKTIGDQQFDASYKSYGDQESDVPDTSSMDQESNMGKKSNENWEVNVTEKINGNQDFIGVSEVNKNFDFTESGNPELELEVPKSKIGSDDIPSTPIKQHSEENLQAESSSSSSLPSVASWEPQIPIFQPYGNAILENEDIIQIKDVGQEYSVGRESDQQLTDLDVVTVLQKQKTHDLFCPNCNSRITKRVILQKRKRIVQDIQQKAKRDKFESVVAIEVSIPNVKMQSQMYSDEREPEVFTCLSCLSFFIPKGRGFKLFSFFGARSGGENMTSEGTTVNLNQSPHLPSAVPEESRFETDVLHPHVEKANTFEQVGTSIHHENVLASHDSDHIVIGRLDKTNRSDSVLEVHQRQINVEPDEAEETQSVSKIEFPVSIQPFHVPGDFSPTIEAPASVHSFEIPDVRTDEAPKLNTAEDSIAAQGSTPFQKLVTAVGKTSGDGIEKIKEEEVIINVETGPSTEVATQGEEENVVEAKEVQQWDILKSIVYGGLVESITSLGVVLSAAGADTSTVNVLALGLANLIGGLFIIGNNFRDLKNEQSSRPSTENAEQVDRYTETLGRRENFRRHAVVAVLAFLIFGLLPPIIYGFTFRASDNRDYKSIAVLAASLFCIALLALGKAHSKSPPKSYVKTVLYFVSIAVVASGASFIIGSLIKKLLDKLGWFETSSSSTIYMPFPEVIPSGSWASF